MDLGNAKATYTLGILAKHLPEEVVKKLYGVRDATAIVTYQGVEFFVDPHYLGVEYSKEQHQFYVLYMLEDELPEFLRGVPAWSIKASGSYPKDLGVTVMIETGSLYTAAPITTTVKISATDWETMQKLALGVRELLEGLAPPAASDDHDDESEESPAAQLP